MIYIRFWKSDGGRFVKKMDKVVILGAGVAGLSAAYQLKKAGVEAVIYEQEDTYGGLCNSFVLNGFTFDTFGHISFDPSTRQWLEDKTEHLTHEPEALNYEHGRWLRHPVQNNLFGLPVEERVELIKGFINRNNSSPSNYAEWLDNTYGKCFAERYPYRYTRKYWTVDPEQLEVKWIKGRMYEPDIEEVLRGAMTPETPGVHYSRKAHYPLNGGFKAFLTPMAEECEIKYKKQASKINTETKRIIFKDGEEISYDYLISTIPLPDLCDSLEGTPDKVREASGCLDYTTGVMVSLGFNHTGISPALWYYIYDEDIFPSRVYSPDWKSPNNVPKGCSAIQAEIYFSRYKPLQESMESLMDNVIRQMLRLQLFEEKDIVLKDVRMKKYANIMFTPMIYEARDVIHCYLESKKIFWAGRFGEWDYLWVGQSLMSGKKTAENCLKEMKKNDIASQN